MSKFIITEIAKKSVETGRCVDVYKSPVGRNYSTFDKLYKEIVKIYDTIFISVLYKNNCWYPKKKCDLLIFGGDCEYYFCSLNEQYKTEDDPNSIYWVFYSSRPNPKIIIEHLLGIFYNDKKEQERLLKFVDAIECEHKAIDPFTVLKLYLLNNYITRQQYDKIVKIGRINKIISTLEFNQLSL